ncbi:hypothetical protein DL770_009960 [Monosporascus sp. CRB-9-2]|nr:hypothetical protein DL770_009960 [Monosporascus sp. CRB-9-2]
MPEPIAIIGSGCRFPGGADTPSKLWSLISQPIDLSRKPSASRFNIDLFYHPVGTHHGTTDATKSYWLDDMDRSNVAHFDAGFFNIQPGEVDAMDPQQRLLLEVVYDGLCAAGLPIEKYRGSDTAIYVGMMCDDYNTMLNRDWETLPRYSATGLERAIVANRVSYFFDWHGPSMSIDTACSSSMVALDQAVQVLRSGKSRMAVAAGTSLILSPGMYISESSLGMLSPSGRCAMWDATADGYARGEGVAAVFLKTLSQALADNDPIECIIRETAVNQDGRTPGLTMPSSIAQAALIRDCYARAGLHPVDNVRDRPQYFHAHGTGTQAGDPQEAQAISSALFPVGSRAVNETDKLLVGSVKTVIGHTEGTAGVASVISTSLALRHRIIPPNLHFQKLSPTVAPFFEHLDIPTVPMAWLTEKGQTRRASVNSFGFGGTNAHCILEEFVPESKVNGIPPAAKTSSSLLYTPLIFSAASATALETMLSQHLDYLQSHPDVVLTDLAYTLQHRRSTFPYRKAIAAPTIADAIQSLEGIVHLPPNSKDEAGLDTRFNTLSRPAKILGIFTGQGAQWPRMGAQLIESSPFAASCIAELDAVLQGLDDASSRPAWTIRDQLLASADRSRLAEAEISQPLCTAVQIVLVDILRAAGISFAAVVGHSSGEIGAAYASGLVSARDAILIAYFRGVHAKLASSPTQHRPRGAMIAVGTSMDGAQALCDDRFAGRMQVAAVNSSSSVTLSGDEDAIDEAEQILKAQGTFARKLKVDKAYHSAHMASCARPYLASLDGGGVRPSSPLEDASTIWFSSVFEGERMNRTSLNNQYWVDNMCNTVMFAGALTSAVQEAGPFDLAIEVGPHPALKAPATAIMQGIMAGANIPYTSLLSRGQSDTEQLSAGLGSVWTSLGSDSVQFGSVEVLLSGIHRKRVLSDLPPYPFDHQRTYWTSNRLANHFKHRSPHQAPNPLLGTPCVESSTTGEMQWRNILRPGEIAWLKGHMLQGQTIFPATGYVSMAVEATMVLAQATDPNAAIGQIRLTDVEIPRAIAFDDDSASVETIFSVSSVNMADSVITAAWTCYSVSDGVSNTVLNATGRASVQLSQAVPDSLDILKPEEPFNLVHIKDEHFYVNLSRMGYGYSPPFRGVSNIRRKLGYSIGTVSDQSGSAWDDGVVIHPGLLDSALQTIFAAWSFPGDTQLQSLHVPVSIAAITLNPYFTELGGGRKQSILRYETSIRTRKHSAVVGDIYLQTADGCHSFARFEGVTLVPISPTTAADDLPMFSRFQYSVASPDGQLAAAGETLSTFDVQMYKDIDRVSYWFARNASLSIPPEQRESLLPHFKKYLRWCDRMVDMVNRSAHPRVLAEYGADTRHDVRRILARYQGRKDVRFVEVVGDNLIDVIRSGNSMLEHMNQDGLLRAFYEENALCAGPAGRWLSRIVAQISHRFSNLNILEIGAGTGATTSAVLRALGEAYASYTFTDISSGFFLSTEEEFGKEAPRMSFKTLNMEKNPAAQGFVEGSYDVLLAMNVLHVSVNVETTIVNIRRLLKPGGFLIVGELTSTDLLFTGMTVGTLPGWWIGAETGRPWGPLLTLDQWNVILKKTGFAGIDTVTPNISSSLPISVFVAQAVDERVELLRKPLAVTKHPAGVRTDKLAIVGGTTPPVFELTRKVSETISFRFQVKEFFNTVGDFASSRMARSVSDSGPLSVLCLTDLDKPYLEDLTAEAFSALKVLWSASSTMLWVTRGARDATPYSNMMTGLAHTVKKEYPNLDVQTFDLDSTDRGCANQNDTAVELAEALLRQVALHSWGEDADALLWTAEPQIFKSQGRQLISRLFPDSEKNERYNAGRRNIFADARPATETLELVATGDGRGWHQEIHKVSPLSVIPAPTIKHRRVRVAHSLLQSLYVGGMGFFRLCTGTDVATGEVVLGLSGSSASPATIPEQWCFPLLGMPAASELVSLAAYLVAENIVSLTPKGGILLVHDADRALRLAIQAKAKTRNISAIFTTADAQQNQDPAVVLLRPNFPQHVLRSVVPASTAAFVYMSRGAVSQAVKVAIDDCLSPTCIRISEEAMLGHEVNLFVDPEPSVQLTQLLSEAWNNACRVDANEVNHIALEDVSDHIAVGEPLAPVCWNVTGSVKAKVQPIDSGVLFRADRTYLFVGMAGELGQSLAEWMVARGARCVVLTSRTPRVNPRFIAAMKRRYGAVIKAMSVDVTSREALSSVHAAIKAALPPIAGVVNGAMVLHDELFANMTFEQFTCVTEPKVTGTRLLDELFHNDTSLEFFIVASSISSVINWGGQSNYTAANDFMTSLARQRRNRGVAGSAINIPAVLGVGYAAQPTAFDFDYFQSLGYFNISEEDLHVLFAEAMLSGQPGQAPHISAQVAMGINFMPADLVVKRAHKRDIKFNHFIMREKEDAKVQTVKTHERVKVQLETVNSQEEAYAVTRNAFLTRLKRILRMPEEEKVDDAVTLVDQGVDSLVGVDIRSWFLKEMDVDMPTLKILGGGSIAELLEAALEKTFIKVDQSEDKDTRIRVEPYVTKQEISTINNSLA